MLSKEQIKSIIIEDAKTDPEERIVFRTNDLDLSWGEIAEIESCIDSEDPEKLLPEYVIFVDQSYVDTPIAAHWEPVPPELNDLAYDLLG